eukprot:COSAG01_NODE_4710_length_4797_cov_62.853160_4_plen_158_part_00
MYCRGGTEPPVPRRVPRPARDVRARTTVTATPRAITRHHGRVPRHKVEGPQSVANASQRLWKQGGGGGGGFFPPPPPPGGPPPPYPPPSRDSAHALPITPLAPSPPPGGGPGGGGGGGGGGACILCPRTRRGGMYQMAAPRRRHPSWQSFHSTAVQL